MSHTSACSTAREFTRALRPCSMSDRATFRTLCYKITARAGHISGTRAPPLAYYPPKVNHFSFSYKRGMNYPPTPNGAYYDARAFLSFFFFFLFRDVATTHGAKRCDLIERNVKKRKEARNAHRVNVTGESRCLIATFLNSHGRTDDICVFARRVRRRGISPPM